MSLVERFTRDDASKYVWGSLMLAAILGLVFSFTSGGDAVREERVAAERRSAAYVDDVLMPRLAGVELDAPLTGQALGELREGVERSILADRRVARVRIWASDGTLLFSTDRSEEPGSNAALNDELLRRVADGTTLTRWNLSDVGGVDEEGRSLLRTYAPLRSGAVAEIDQTEEGTVGPVTSSWLRYQILAGFFVALFLGMTVLSLRDPYERLNSGVPFAPSSVPAGHSLIDDERLHAVEEVYRLAHERVAKLETRLAESEEVRRRLEGDLQRALTTAATGGATTHEAATPTAPAASTTASPEPVAPSRAPTLIERAVQSAASPGSAPAPRSKRRRDKRAAAASTEPRPAAAAEAPDRAAAPVASPTQTPTVVTVPESEVVGDRMAPPAAAPAGALARTTRDDRPAPRPEPRVGEKPKRQLRKRKEAPAAAVATVPATDVDDAKAHEAALETFIRLTESDRQHQGSADVDQGAVRAALARTAARKKPGGARLQPHEEPVEEILGGGPPRDDR